MTREYIAAKVIVMCALEINRHRVFVCEWVSVRTWKEWAVQVRGCKRDTKMQTQRHTSFNKCKCAPCVVLITTFLLCGLRNRSAFDFERKKGALLAQPTFSIYVRSLTHVYEKPHFLPSQPKIKAKRNKEMHIMNMLIDGEMNETDDEANKK